MSDGKWRSGGVKSSYCNLENIQRVDAGDHASAGSLDQEMLLPDVTLKCSKMFQAFRSRRGSKIHRSLNLTWRHKRWIIYKGLKFESNSQMNWRVQYRQICITSLFLSKNTSTLLQRGQLTAVVEVPSSSALTRNGVTSRNARAFGGGNPNEWRVMWTLFATRVVSFSLIAVERSLSTVYV